MNNLWRSPYADWSCTRICGDRCVTLVAFDYYTCPITALIFLTSRIHIGPIDEAGFLREIEAHTYVDSEASKLKIEAP